MRRILVLTLLAVAALAPAAGATTTEPDVVPLPRGFQPEGIATGLGPTFYVGSIPTGAIYRGNLRTGEGEVLVPGRAGRNAVGIEVDRRNRLWVSGGASGEVVVYDARTGEELAAYRFPRPETPSGALFVNDVVVTREAAYFTDSINQRVLVVPVGRYGELPAEGRVLPLTGDIAYAPGFNANGIEATPDGRALVLVQSNTGRLFRVDPRTGVATGVELGGVTLPFGDGLLLRGRRLYVVQNQLNRVAVVRLERDGRAGALQGTITRPELDVPTTLAAFGRFLYAVNARFSTPPGPDVAYAVVRLPRRPAG